MAVRLKIAVPISENGNSNAWDMGIDKNLRNRQGTRAHALSFTVIVLFLFLGKIPWGQIRSRCNNG